MNLIPSPVTSDLPSAQRGAFGLPEDLRVLTGECVLLDMALEATTEVVEQLRTRGSHLTDGSNWRALLTLLCYSYATGVYASEEIESNCLCDPATRYLAGNLTASARLLQAFRRGNRPWIEQALARVLSRAVRRPTDAGPWQPPGSDGAETESDCWLQAARQRVQTAILLDLELAD